MGDWLPERLVVNPTVICFGRIAATAIVMETVAGCHSPADGRQFRPGVTGRKVLDWAIAAQNQRRTSRLVTRREKRVASTHHRRHGCSSRDLR